jgi:hypothetical protein
VAPARTLYTAIVKNEAFLAMALMPLGNYLANLAGGNFRPTKNIRTFLRGAGQRRAEPFGELILIRSAT